jgi:hypothetical protein
MASAQSEWHDRLEFTKSWITLELKTRTQSHMVKGAGRWAEVYDS